MNALATTNPAVNVVDFDEHRSAEQAAKELVPVLSEDHIALEFASRHSDSVRFDWTTKKWHTWSGNRWRRDDTAVAFGWTRALVRSLARDQNTSDRRRLGSKKFFGWRRRVSTHRSADRGEA
jgi:phage/plasmid-associated DNA primase